MNSTEDKVFRVGCQSIRGLLTSLEVFLSVLAKKEFKDKPYEKIADEVNKAYAYTDATSFFSDQINLGKSEFDSIGIESAQIQKFDQLATQYGLKYYYVQRPENLDEVFAKKQHTDDDLAMLKQWTYEKNGERCLVKDDYKITFAIKDIQKVECIVKDLRQYTNMLLQSRIKNSAEKNPNNEHHNKQKSKKSEKKAERFGDK